MPTTDASSEGKDSNKEEEKTPEAAIGPVPPTEEEYDPAEIEKAEEFKSQGNQHVKGK